MNKMLFSKWGDSAAVDQIWSQAAGMKPSLISGRRFLVLQAFIDESEDKDFFVLAGGVASVPAWASFSKDWEDLLPLAPLRSDGKRAFKFSHMHGRLEDMPAFWHVIEGHVPLIVESVVDIEDLRAVQSSIFVDGEPAEFNDLADPYMVAFKLLMDGLHHKQGRLTPSLGPSDVIDFYFDEHSNKRKIRLGWDRYVEGKPSVVRQRFGREPRFEDDCSFLPLQAADFIAGLTRTTGRTQQGKDVRNILAQHSKKVIPTLRVRSYGSHLMTWLARQIKADGKLITDGLNGQRLRGADE